MRFLRLFPSFLFVALVLVACGGDSGSIGADGGEGTESSGDDGSGNGGTDEDDSGDSEDGDESEEEGSGEGDQNGDDSEEEEDDNGTEDEGSSGDDGDGEMPEAEEVRDQAFQAGLDGQPAGGRTAVRPDEDPLVNLGKTLFFSRTLSARLDVACASCHHPELAGGDELSLSVGVAARNPEILGLGRELDPERDLDPRADGGPNVRRNSPSVFNVALYDRALLQDGGVFVLDDEVSPGGEGQRIRTPESGNVADPDAGNNLLEAQARLPLARNTEMRDFMYSSISDAGAYRERILDRLRGEADAGFLAPDAADNWLELFQSHYPEPDADSGEWITAGRVTEALAAYQQSMIFVDTPWNRFLDGEDEALSAAARRGALLFFGEGEDGLGCAACHAGDTFTDEQFYNVGFPQIGRGSRPDGSDRGRADVSVELQTEGNQHAFRVPGLLNVGITGPYGHAGTFNTLEQMLRYHADPEGQVELFDFDLQHLPQATTSGASGLELYPDAEALTLDALAAASFAEAEPLLPGRALFEDEVEDLVAFLSALTDDCAADPACVSPWVARSGEHDPDGMLLVRDEPFEDVALPDDEEGDFGQPVELSFPSVSEINAADRYAELAECDGAPSTAANEGSNRFLRRDHERGLSAVHGFSEETWLRNAAAGSFGIDETMFAGGVSAGFFSDPCYPDLVFSGGDHPDASPVTLYRNTGAAGGFAYEALPVFAEGPPPGPFTGIGFADLNGNYRSELILANLHQGETLIYSADDQGDFHRAGELPMGRSTFGMAFGDMDGSGYPDLFLSHWSPTGLPGTAPAFWRNSQGQVLEPADEEVGTSSADISQEFTFAPGFADLNLSGRQDLAIASDFNTSVVLQNQGEHFVDVTDGDVIDDSNGMGAALGDFNNDGRLDWFVNSVELPEDHDWAGNRLYWNKTAGDTIVFENAGNDIGIKDGGWGWGACAADFNNNGWLDIFHVNGYGVIPEEFEGTLLDEYIEDYQGFAEVFGNDSPRLFINNGDGTFTESSSAWWGDLEEPFPESEGRGVACFDYDRDGDVDIAVLDHSGGIQLFENQTAAGPGARFVNVRLVGEGPNTAALGARVYVTADIGDDSGEEVQQLRAVAANSNFLGQNPPDLHFGLGHAEAIDELRIVWPGDGGELVCSDLPVNRFLVFQEGQAVCPGPE